MNDEFSNLIDDIGDSIARGDTAIFCGAGISYNSGLPLANDLLRKILSALDFDDVNASTILESNLPFESFIGTLADETNINEILDIFSNGEPNTNHALIAELAAAGYVKTILTTNFDVLIEKSLAERGLKNGQHFEVYSTEVEFGKIDWIADKVKVVKIHGCVSNKTEMAITLDTVASRTITQNKSNLINSFFSKKMHKNVLVIGYSCSDLFDISPQIELIDNELCDVFLVEHVSNISDYSIQEICFKKYKNPFQNFVGKRIAIDADLFVKKIWEKLLTAQYQYKNSSISWYDNIRSWTTGFSSFSVGLKHQIAGRLYYDIGEYEHAIANWEKGIVIAQRESNLTFFYCQLGNLGMALNAVGRYNDAKRCLEEAVNANLDIGNIQGHIAQLQALGIIYRNLRKFEASANMFGRAISLAEKYELEGLCTSLGNLASVYNQTEQPDKAIEVLLRGISIAFATGNKQSEGSMLCSLGIAYFQKGDYPNARRFISESIDVTRSIGDKQGECMALLNLSNLCLQFEEFVDCLKCAVAALQIAMAIGIRQSEAGAHYNIGSSYFFSGDVETAIPHFKKAIEIYSSIYGSDHAHTVAAVKALFRAEQFPAINKITKLNLI